MATSTFYRLWGLQVDLRKREKLNVCVGVLFSSSQSSINLILSRTICWPICLLTLKTNSTTANFSALACGSRPGSSEKSDVTLLNIWVVKGGRVPQEKGYILRLLPSLTLFNIWFPSGAARAAFLKKIPPFSFTFSFSLTSFTGFILKDRRRGRILPWIYYKRGSNRTWAFLCLKCLLNTKSHS